MPRCVACPSLCIDTDRCCVDGCHTHYCPDHHDARCIECGTVCCWRHKEVVESESYCPECAKALTGLEAA